MSGKHKTTDAPDMVKATEQFLALGQGNLDAFVKSSQIWAAGVQGISRQATVTAQAGFDEALAAYRALAAAKTPKDVLDIQAKLVRTSMEQAIAETGKVSDASLRLAEQAIAPLTAQMNAASGKWTKVA
jgi:phasin family protein